MDKQVNIRLYSNAAETIKDAILRGQYEALKGENKVQTIRPLQPKNCANRYPIWKN